jgi:hypothetical protein
MAPERRWVVNGDNSRLIKWPIVLTADLGSARNFWDGVLAFATDDCATSVQFVPHRGEDCLFCTVEGINHPMVPPPEHLREWLLRAGRNLLAGSKWRGRLWWWKAHLRGGESSDVITVVTAGVRVQWLGVFTATTLTFHRT